MIKEKKKKQPIEYNRTIVFKYEPSFEERESQIKRAIYLEQEQYKNKNLKWIVVEKTMEKVVIKFRRKA